MFLYVGIRSYDGAVESFRSILSSGGAARSSDWDPSSEWCCRVSGSGILSLHGVCEPLLERVVAMNRSWTVLISTSLSIPSFTFTFASR
jgi:hypothetical protein